MNELNYLKVTMYDNDFTGDYKILGNLIKDMLYSYGYYTEYEPGNHIYNIGNKITKDDLPIIKGYIGDIWCAIHNMGRYLKWRDTSIEYKDTPREIFDCNLAIVPYSEVEKIDWANGEEIYIPLFSKDMEVLLK